LGILQIKAIRHNHHEINPSRPSIKQIKVQTMPDQPYLLAEKKIEEARYMNVGVK
jgi:hypothetical protein